MQTLEDVVEFLTRHQLMLTTAESCTAGLMSGLLADVAGCGDPNGTCEWLAYGANCAPVPRTWTCQDLP